MHSFRGALAIDDRAVSFRQSISAKVDMGRVTGGYGVAQQ